MTTSLPYCHSETRPEHLAEFETAGVPPYSQVSFPAPGYQEQREEATVVPRYSKASLPAPGSQGQREVSRTRKVILDAPEKYASGALGANVAAIVVGVGVVFAVAFIVPMMFMFAILRGITKANRRGRWHHW